MLPLLALPTTLQNRYRVLSVIGQGGFGRTYLAEQLTRFNEPCVLKEFTPAQTDRAYLEKARSLFQREAETLYQLRHPQIPQFRELFEDQGRFFLVQDYIAGATYEQLLRQQRFNEAQVRALLTQILPVLIELHSHRIIHGDISPDNIIQRDRDQVPVLIDFGAVKRLVTQLNPGQVSTQTIVGKPGYAAPEQLRTGQVDDSSDLYALGATAAVLLTGRPVHQLYNDRDRRWQWQAYIEPPTEISPDFANFLDHLLQAHPRDRYRSARAARAVLQSLPLCQGAAPLTLAPPTYFSQRALAPGPAQNSTTNLPQPLSTRGRYSGASSGHTQMAELPSGSGPSVQAPGSLRQASRMLSQIRTVALLGKARRRRAAPPEPEPAPLPVPRQELAGHSALATQLYTPPVSPWVWVSRGGQILWRSLRWVGKTALALFNWSTKALNIITLGLIPRWAIALILVLLGYGAGRHWVSSGQIGLPGLPGIQLPSWGLSFQDRSAQLQVDTQWATDWVNAEFRAKHPEVAGRLLSQGLEDEALRQEWNDLGQSLLDKVENNLPQATRSRLGQYGSSDVGELGRAARQYNLSAAALFELADARFNRTFPARLNDGGFIRQPVGQVWYGIAYELLSQMAAGKVLEKVEAAPGSALTAPWERQFSASLKPGEGRAYVMFLPRNQTLNLRLEGDNTRLYVWSPNGKTLLKASPERSWNLRTQEEGYYEVVVISEPGTRYRLEAKVQ